MKRLFACTLMLFAAAPTFAADANGYTAKYECRAGGQYCNVDVAALGNRTCSQTISTSTPWSSINWSNNTICLEAGDHTGKGTLTIPSSANGSSGQYKVLRYTRSGDNDDEPWNQTEANKAKLYALRVDGSYWIIHRLSFPRAVGSGLSPRIESGTTGGKTNHIINRIFVEGGTGSTMYYGYSQNCNFGGHSDYTIQNSVFRDQDPIGGTHESIGIDVSCGNNVRIVNNEVYNWVSHPIQVGHNFIPTLTGLVVENNDLYVTPTLYTQGGARMKSESGLSVKAKGTSGSPVLIIKNRLWGNRVTDLSFCCNGEGGNAVTYYQVSDYVIFKNNTIFDAQIGINNVAARTSFIGNIFWKIKQYDSTNYSSPIHTWNFGQGDPNERNDTHEIYLNTIIDSTHRSMPALAGSNVDTRCNTFLSSGPKESGTPPVSSIGDFNVFYDTPLFTFNGTNTNIDRPVSTRSNSTAYSLNAIIRTGAVGNCASATDSACFLYRVTTAGTSAGSPPVYTTTLGGTTTDGTMVVKAIRGPHTFKRKLRTFPENVVIPYAKVHIDAPEARGCPSNYAARTGIGINDIN